MGESLRRMRRRVEESAAALEVCKSKAACCKESFAKGAHEAQSLWLQILPEELERSSREARHAMLLEMSEAVMAERHNAFQEGRRHAYKEMAERHVLLRPLSVTGS